MASIKIVTDSTADIPLGLAHELGIEVVPMHLHVGDQTYRAGLDITNDQFYQLLQDGRGRHTLDSMRAVLADHDASGACFVRGAAPDQEQFYTICMHEGPSRTAMGMTAILEPAPDLPRTAWLAFGRPCTSVWFPLLVAGTLPEALLRAGEEGAPGREGLWWLFEQMAARAEDSPEERSRIRATLDAVGSDLASEHAALRRDLAGVAPDVFERRATAAAADVARRLEITARDLLAACA